MNEEFEIIGKIEQIENNCVWWRNQRNRSAAESVWQRLLAKRKGKATVRLEDGTIHFVELHWYEAQGIG